jgi:GDP-4-dehydro-6-deoxy-D-mannose reductase
MRNALIVGARGFCARHLAQRLRHEPQTRVIGLARGAVPSGASFDEWHAVDLRDSPAVARAIAAMEPDWVFHLAGLVAGPAADLYETNALGTLHLLEALRQHAPGTRLLLVGSAAEYGPDVHMPVAEDDRCSPRGPYALSKYAATLAGLDYARRFDMQVMVARPFNVVGAGMPTSLVLGAVLARVVDALEQQRPLVVRVGNIDTVRDFIAVEDVIDAYVAIMQHAAAGEIFNVCSGEPQRVGDMVAAMLAHAPRPVALETDTSLIRADDVAAFYGNPGKASAVLAFRPRVPIGESLRRAWLHATRTVQSGHEA